MPLYAYSSTVVIENGKLVATMKPLASVVELELNAAQSWNVDGVSLAVSALQKGTYATAAGAVVDAATGAIDLAAATTGSEVKVALGSTVDLSKGANVQMVVMGLTSVVTTPATETTPEVTDLYAPIYHGKAVLKTYKAGAENARRTIWAAYAPGAEVVNEHKHIYQPVANVLKDKVADGISTAAEFKAFADAVNNTIERYPAGAEFSNEDGVVVLKNSISLAEYDNWMSIGCNNDAAQTIKPQFSGIFDGGNNTISGLQITHSQDYKISFLNAEGQAVESVQNNAALFGILANGGVIKNLTVAGEITMNDSGDGWSYAAGVVAQVSGGTVENCTSGVAISAGTASTGKCRIGGVVGRVYPTTADVTVKDCKNENDIDLTLAVASANKALVGGVVGFMGDGNGYAPYITNCTNSASVNVFNTGKDTCVGGIIGQAAHKTETDGLFSDLKNTGAVCVGSTEAGCSALYVGGIIGKMDC